jgi:hypothetical protein
MEGGAGRTADEVILRSSHEDYEIINDAINKGELSR